MSVEEARLILRFKLDTEKGEKYMRREVASLMDHGFRGAGLRSVLMKKFMLFPSDVKWLFNYLNIDLPDG